VTTGKARWKLIRSRLREIAKAVAGTVPGSVVEVEIPNGVIGTGQSIGVETSGGVPI
jgi:hypothetical protein